MPDKISGTQIRKYPKSNTLYVLGLCIGYVMNNNGIYRIFWRITHTAYNPHWHKNVTFSKKNQQITPTAVLPAPLTFCVKINRFPTGNMPENTVYTIGVGGLPV